MDLSLIAWRLVSTYRTSVSDIAPFDVNKENELNERLKENFGAISGANPIKSTKLGGHSLSAFKTSGRFSSVVFVFTLDGSPAGYVNLSPTYIMNQRFDSIIMIYIQPEFRGNRDLLAFMVNTIIEKSTNDFEFDTEQTPGGSKLCKALKHHGLDLKVLDTEDGSEYPVEINGDRLQVKGKNLYDTGQDKFRMRLILRHP